MTEELKDLEAVKKSFAGPRLSRREMRDQRREAEYRSRPVKGSNNGFGGVTHRRARWQNHGLNSPDQERGRLGIRLGMKLKPKPKEEEVVAP